jgi:hypothetical protein
MRRGAKRPKPKSRTKAAAARRTKKPVVSRGELEKRLAEAREQQSATSDILRVISGSQTDIQPVFDAIVRSAVRLCGADHSIAARFDGEMLYPLASYGFSPEARAIIERSFPMRPTMENMLGRATVKRAASAGEHSDQSPSNA